MDRKFLTSIALSVIAILFAASACSKDNSLRKAHPFELTTAPVCSGCHGDDPKLAYDHTPDFARKHSSYAAQGRQICTVCHAPSFCSDCHAGREELTPDMKLKTSPERFSPHRGDYMTQHKMDGRIDPARCFVCHGRSNNARCSACHK